MWYKLKLWIHSKFFLNSNSIVGVVPVVTEQVNERDAQTKKRVAAAFKQQEAAMNARALVAHGAHCPDPMTCTKKRCFRWEPDKIVLTHDGKDV